MQDIGGLRIVQDMTRSRQDEICRRIVAALHGDASVVDRRADPRSGYRAVHILTTAQGCRVEVQVRTMLQDLWAEVMEWLADQWGRQMRYGEPPSAPGSTIRSVNGRTRADVYASLLRFADDIAAHEEAVVESERALHELGVWGSGGSGNRLARTRAEVQAARREIVSLFEPMVRDGIGGGRLG